MDDSTWICFAFHNLCLNWPGIFGICFCQEGLVFTILICSQILLGNSLMNKVWSSSTDTMPLPAVLCFSALCPYISFKLKVHCIQRLPAKILLTSANSGICQRSRGKWGIFPTKLGQRIKKYQKVHSVNLQNNLHFKSLMRRAAVSFLSVDSPLWCSLSDYL